MVDRGALCMPFLALLIPILQARPEEGYEYGEAFLINLTH